MMKRQKEPHIVKKFFKKSSTAYAEEEDKNVWLITARLISEVGGDFMEVKFILSGGGGGFKSHTPLLFIPHAAIKSDINTTTST